MTFYRVCGLSLLLTAISLSGCSSMAKKQSEVVTPEDNSTVNTSSTTDTTDSSTSNYNITTLDTTPNTDFSLDSSNTTGKVSKKKSAVQTASTNKSNHVAKKYSALGQPDQALINFPFDSDELSADDLQTLQQHLSFLQKNPSIKVVLKGHTDERGTVNYNLALGEKRANSVQAFLVSNGINANRIDVISFGETKPIATSHTEEAWAKNRRVEVVYL